MRSGNSECIDSLTPARQRTHRSQLSADHKHRFCAGSDSLESWRAAQQWEEIVAARQGATLQHCESLPLPPVAHAVEPCERSRIIDARFVETAARAAVPRSGPRSAVRHSRAAPPRRCNMHATTQLGTGPNDTPQKEQSTTGSTQRAVCSVAGCRDRYDVQHTVQRATRATPALGLRSAGPRAGYSGYSAGVLWVLGLRSVAPRRSM